MENDGWEAVTPCLSIRRRAYAIPSFTSTVSARHQFDLAQCSLHQHARRACFPAIQKLKNNFEELNAFPFSRIIGIERCVLHPNAVASRRPRIEHLKRVATPAKGFRKCSLNSGSFGNRRRRLHRAHWFLRTERCSEFLCRNCRNQRGHDCDHQCLHVSLSFDACEMLPITTPAHNISFDGFS
jgi:hypothetical protein